MEMEIRDLQFFHALVPGFQTLLLANFKNHVDEREENLFVAISRVLNPVASVRKILISLIPL